jgi:hypothetical protein
MAVPNYLLEEETPSRTTGYRKAAVFLASIALVAVVVTIAVTAGAPTQELAAKAKKATPLKFGASVTLMTSYNEYITVDKAGTIVMNGFSRGDNAIKIVSPKGKKAAVKYGDKCSLMGQNGKYFLARYSGKVTGRSTVISRDSEWSIVGGSGGVQIGDRVSFKDEFGYLTVQTDGAGTNAQAITVMQKYLVGLPGQENGLRLATGLMYGEVVSLMNKNQQYLQIDHNGWGTVHGHPDGNWDHFAVLSNEHREGHVSFGDRVVLRAHNGRFISIRQDNKALEAVSRSITDQSQFQMLGTMSGASTGYVHSRDMVVLKAASGYLEAVPQGNAVRAVTGPTGHYTPNSEFQLKKVWDATL